MAYQIEQRDEQLIGTTAAIRYEVSFDRAEQHLVRISMIVSNVASNSVRVALPAWTPGSYKVRDYAGDLGNIEAYTVRGADRRPTTTRFIDKQTIEIDTAGADTIVIDYVIYGLERTVRTNHINRFHAFLVPTATFMYVEGRTDEIHHVLFKHDRSRWPNISTQLSPVEAPSQKGVLLGALNYDILADSPIEVGDHEVRFFEVKGAKHELAVASTYTHDMDWLVEQLKTIVSTEADLFGGLPYDRYVFILQAYPGIYGGLEHSRSSVNACDPEALKDKKKVLRILSLLCHEFFHTWNVKRIRPVQLGPFDYTQEVYTPMHWLTEGFTSYYDDHLTYRCGFYTEKEYLELLSDDHVTKLLNVPGRKVLSVRDSSYLAWLKLYFQSADGVNRFPSYYLKGGVVALLLDLYIIDHSDGRSSLDDGMKALWARYQQDPSTGVTEEECIAILERSTGIQLRERLMSWLDGTDELPYAEVMEPIGLRFQIGPKPNDEDVRFGQDKAFASVAPKVSCGWSVSASNGSISVRSVLDGGPAQAAGIGVDDEIVALNGKRVTSVEALDRYLADHGLNPVRVTAHCDGRLYETTMTPEPVVIATITKIEPMSERQQRNFKRWLSRTS